MDWQIPAAVGCSFLVSWLLTALLIRWALRLGLVDHPNARKVHVTPIPKGGGLAIFAGFSVASFFLPLSIGQFFLFGLIVGLGLIDDLRPLSWQLRLGVQTAVVLVSVLLWPAEVSWPLRAVAVFWVVAMLNAFNLLDNMDALSGGVAWIAAAFLALACLTQARSASEGGTSLVLIGALSGFLWFNRPPARIFMGDAGSTFLGFFLGLSSLDVALPTSQMPWAWAVPLCIFAVPCYDTTSVVLLRLAQGRSPFHPDKQHLSHRLVARGLRSTTAVGVIYLMAVASGVSGLLLYHVADATGAYLVVGQFACWWCALAVFEFVVPRK
jgi:UDP-GlcNAc:undecaprenyl-phosphate/decaprenyl-phosphate GlcNAc-1-phosphate transferase